MNFKTARLAFSITVMFAIIQPVEAIAGGEKYSSSSESQSESRAVSKSSENVAPPYEYKRANEASISSAKAQPSPEIDEMARARAALPIYNRVKDKSWDQLSAKEQAYAISNGIPDAATFEAWKVQMASFAATQPASKGEQSAGNSSVQRAPASNAESKNTIAK